MVAIYNTEDEYGKNPRTLGDWVKNFRLKKMEMKRNIRSGGNLRVCAILSTALMNAELELRRKQQERFQKWLEFQTKINKNHELQHKNELRHHPKMRRHPQSEEELVLISNQHNEEKNCKQTEEITNLWKCELSELDNFMRSISGSASKNVEQNIKQSKSHCDTVERDIYQRNIERHSTRVSS